MILLYLAGYIFTVILSVMLAFHHHLSRRSRIWICGALSIAWPIVAFLGMSVAVAWLVDFFYNFFVDLLGIAIKSEQETTDERVKRLIDENHSIINQVIGGRDFEDKAMLLRIIMHEEKNGANHNTQPG